MTQSLTEVWNDLTKDLNDHRHVWWKKILERLMDGKRKYHNLDHLENKYKIYFEVKHLLVNKQAFEYALFFSYFEYEPQLVSTDEKNIEHFKSFCKDCGIPLDSDIYKDAISLLGCIGSHITDEHITEGVFGKEDKHYFLDIDMAILGSNPEEYAEYNMKVKEEYDFLPDGGYEALRVKVLQTFLQIPNIFATNEFREKYEKQAKINILNEIKLLQD